MRIFGRAMTSALPLLAMLIAFSLPAAAQQASEAQRNAIRQACPADYQRLCAAVPAGGKASFECLARNLGHLSPACQRAVGSVSAGGGATHAAPSSGTPARSVPPAAAASAAPPMSPREQLALVRQSCAGDYRMLCRGVPLGGGRAIACLRANAASLSPQCGGALSAARQRR